MSYEIVYCRQFIKVDEDHFIPLVLTGSNNCWESYLNIRGRHYERRERNWSPVLCPSGRLPVMTEKELMDKAKSYTGGEYQEHFKRFGKYVDDKGFISFFKKGIKTAKTIEDLKEEDRHPEFVYLNACVSVWKKEKDKEWGTNYAELRSTINSTDELKSFLQKAQEQIEAKKENESNINVFFEFPDDKPIMYPKEKRIRKKKPRLSQNYWVIKAVDGNRVGKYISKLNARSMAFTGYSENAKQFSSEKEADKWAKNHDIDIRFGMKHESVYVA